MGSDRMNSAAPSAGSHDYLPKFEIVDNLAGLLRMEKRQKQLEPLTTEILKSIELAKASSTDLPTTRQ